jgi:caspase domain-containing protein
MRAPVQEIRMQGLRCAGRVVLALAVTPWLLAGAAVAEAQGAREEARTALVIGNSAYRENPLKNPVNDARAMARTLRDLGFTVVLLSRGREVRGHAGQR